MGLRDGNSSRHITWSGEVGEGGGGVEKIVQVTVQFPLCSRTTCVSCQVKDGGARRVSPPRARAHVDT